MVLWTFYALLTVKLMLSFLIVDEICCRPARPRRSPSASMAWSRYLRVGNCGLGRLPKFHTKMERHKGRSIFPAERFFLCKVSKIYWTVVYFQVDSYWTRCAVFLLTSQVDLLLQLQKYRFEEEFAFILPKSYADVQVDIDALPDDVHSCRVQILRSASSWTNGFSPKSPAEHSIEQAYYDVILAAKHYIYIEVRLLTIFSKFSCSNGNILYLFMMTFIW